LYKLIIKSKEDSFDTEKEGVWRH